RRSAASRLAYYRQLHALEENLPQLLGRIQIEWLPGNFVYLPFQLKHLLTQFMALHGQSMRVQPHPIAFNRGQNVGTPYLQLIDSFQTRFGSNARAQYLMQLPGKVGILTGVMRCLVHFNFVEANLLCTLAADFFVAGSATPQPALTQFLQ